MSHFVYMLRCAGNRIYTGYAVDVAARYKQHSEGKGAKFTKAFPPEGILKTFELASKEEALRLEARIKKLSRPQKELLAAGNSDAGSNGLDGTDAAAGEKLMAALMAGLGETLPRKAKASAKTVPVSE